MLTNIQLLSNGASALGITLTDEMLAKFSCFFDLVIESNKLFNLTAITDENDFIVKHYIDSLCGAQFIPLGAKLCDVGAGAGFPSVPLAILRPDLEITALDSTAKKMSFVSSSAEKLGLSHLVTISGRAEEEIALFDKFDIVTARAVSALSILLELALPLLKIGGKFIAYKTDLSELNTVENALATLGGRLADTKSFTLSGGDKRAILVFEKTKRTPSPYPRVFGVIKKKPL